MVAQDKGSTEGLTAKGHKKTCKVGGSVLYLACGDTPVKPISLHTSNECNVLSMNYSLIRLKKIYKYYLVLFSNPFCHFFIVSYS